MTGDVTISNAGVTDITAGVIVDADVSASAAVAYSKLAALPSAQVLVGSVGNVATAVDMTGDITISNAGVTDITAGVIVDPDISVSAAISYSKLAALMSAQVIVGTALNTAAPVDMTGDVTISNTGVTSIAAGAIVDADVSASAAVAYSKLATLTSGNIIVGSAGNVATSVSMSGDVGIVASGATTISANSVTYSKLDASVLQVATFSVTHAEILNLASVGIVVLPTPTAGYFYVINSIELKYTYAGTPYTFAGYLGFGFPGGAYVISQSAYMLTQSASSYYVLTPSIYNADDIGTNTGFYQTTSIGAQLRLDAISGAPTVGTAGNAIDGRVVYRLVQSL